MGFRHQTQIIGHAFFAVFYPNQCQICNVDLTMNEKHVCLACSYDLPYIAQNEYQLQQLRQLFWGRVEIQSVFSLLNYQRGNQTQRILHQLKYKKKKKLGTYFGEVLGATIAAESKFDLILPIPLHPKKERQRGFNQSLMIAEGISKKINVPISTKHLIRHAYNQSQTQFSKYDRWQNVKRIFKVKHSSDLEHKHVLLVDDVLTTGATLEACVAELMEINNCTISIATLAARI